MTEEKQKKGITTFEAFKSRNYRLYFLGQSISLMGTWMQKTAVSWVVYSLTHSKLMLGLSLFATMFPSFVFSFIGGVTADRHNRYRVLLITQVASMIQAALLTLIVLSGHYSVWAILSLSFVLGIINAFDVPARQSLVNELIEDKKYIGNALALNSSMVNLSRLIGPAIAGFILEKFGDVFCFGLNALSFIAVISSLLMMRLPKADILHHKKNILQDMQDGWRYLKQEKQLRFIIAMLGFISLFVLPFSTLMPVYAKDIFRGNASTFGVIDSMIGLGALSGAIFLASLKPGSDIRKVLAINTLIFGSGLVLFSYMHHYLVALACAVLTGFGMMSQVTITNTIVQTTADPAMRGRMISFYAMAFFGMQPLGGLIVGSVSQWIGVPNTVLAEGCIALIIGLLHFRFLHISTIKTNKEPAGKAVQSVEAAVS
ncbi:MFS transporter [Parafilimonas sp.]|uniref:MFS transporter n=1 Tax=Parafilimonas sp. TaxID=1969739 RepID=UPI0039E2DB80